MHNCIKSGYSIFIWRVRCKSKKCVGLIHGILKSNEMSYWNLRLDKCYDVWRYTELRIVSLFVLQEKQKLSFKLSAVTTLISCKTNLPGYASCFSNWHGFLTQVWKREFEYHDFKNAMGIFEMLQLGKKIEMHLQGSWIPTEGSWNLPNRIHK